MPSARLADTGTPSLARSDGLEAVERNVAEEAVSEPIDGVVMPVTDDAPDKEAEDCEPDPTPWPIWW
jgi:hypothetical protein